MNKLEQYLDEMAEALKAHDDIGIPALVSAPRQLVKSALKLLSFAKDAHLCAFVDIREEGGIPEGKVLFTDGEVFRIGEFDHDIASFVDEYDNPYPYAYWWTEIPKIPCKNSFEEKQ